MEPAKSPRRRRTKSADTATAYHEAGHAVAAWTSKGLKAVGRISIEQEDDYSGVSSSKWLLRLRDPELEMTASTRQRVEMEIEVLLAGAVAQRKFNPRSVRHYHGRNDRETAIDLAMYVAGSGRQLEAYLRWLQLRAEASVTMYWPFIGDLAEALVRCRKMTGRELRLWFANMDFKKLQGRVPAPKPK